MDGECSVDDGLVPNMTSCQDFLICLQGRVRRRVRCASGLMFDASIEMCNFENVVNCGLRPKTGNRKCYTANVNVTIKAENLAIQPIFLIETNIQAPRQPLYNFLLMAAGKDKRFSFQTRKIDNYGEFVSSINGLEGREEDYSGWVPSDKRNNQISKGIHEVFPEDGEVITFKFYSFAGNLAALKNLPGLASKLNRK
ncbi:hypothetical protein SNE40_012750 [Patella caerulea]|uniref:Chitin-binding type-2 domain-containing protein n=1 Tax=Patella caerulea TaxID=87958 RepID=A0AAN8JM25_PATCE